MHPSHVTLATRLPRMLVADNESLVHDDGLGAKLFVRPSLSRVFVHILRGQACPEHLVVRAHPHPLADGLP